MTNIRRYWEPGYTYFITHVTHNRAPLLVGNIDLWHESIRFVEGLMKFELVAWVLLPNHIHLLIERGDSDMTNLMKRLKLKFSGSYRARYHHNSGRVCQYRFWDHKIKDQRDYDNHLDYIHYNPVKHGSVSVPKDWPYGSFHFYYDKGYYADDWGIKEAIKMEGSFGE